MMAKVNLSIPQSEAFYAQNPTIGVVAGFGSGKTTTAVVKAFDLLLEYGLPVGYAAPTYGDIKSIWYPAIEEHCLAHGFKFNIHKSDHVIDIIGLGKIVCRSMSNPDKIVGFEVGDFLLDELDILKKDIALNAVRKCKARCRKKFPKKRLKLWGGGREEKKKKKINQLHIYTTPEGYKATHHILVKEPYKNSKLIQMSTYSNIHNLPDGYIDELRATYPPQLVEAYIEGKFTNLKSGTVYSSYDRFLNDCKVTPLLRETLHIGMDFNVGKMVGIPHVIRGGLPMATMEITKVLDTPTMIKVIQNRFPLNPIYIYPDATGSARDSSNASMTDLKLLKLAGFKVVVDGTNPLIKDRVLSMNAMFCNALGIRRYFVNKDTCPSYSEALEQQSYDENGMPDKSSGDDHAPDAGGYFINKAFGIVKPSSSVKSLTM